jgi:UDP-N-acetylglucosamine 2-epimerase
MKVLVMSETGAAEPLDDALEAEGVAAKRPPASLTSAAGDDVGQIAAALVELERLLEADRPDAVLLPSASNLALAAALVATKLRIPVARLEAGTADEDQTSELNGRLIEQLADASLAAQPGGVIAWLRAMRPPEPESARR